MILAECLAEVQATESQRFKRLILSERLGESHEASFVCDVSVARNV